MEKQERGKTGRDEKDRNNERWAREEDEDHDGRNSRNLDCNHLLRESLPLNEGIVQFRVSIAHFLLHHEKFESLGEAGRRPMVFGERRHHLSKRERVVRIFPPSSSYNFQFHAAARAYLRMIADKRRVDAVDFDEISNHLV